MMDHSNLTSNNKVQKEPTKVHQHVQVEVGKEGDQALLVQHAVAPVTTDPSSQTPNNTSHQPYQQHGVIQDDGPSKPHLQ